MDTGSGHDIVTEAELSRADLSKAFDSVNGMSFTTANGLVDAGRQVPMQIPNLTESAEPFVMPESPPLLSVGRRCMLDGYTFIWKAGKEPLLVRPDGQVVELVVDGFIPYINADANVRLPRKEDTVVFPVNPILPVVEDMPAPVADPIRTDGDSAAAADAIRTDRDSAGEAELLVEAASPPVDPPHPPPVDEHPAEDVRDDGSLNEEPAPAHRFIK